MARLVYFIPIRKGSKGIPDKNMKLLGGKPLVAWVLDAIVASHTAAEIWVATDDDRAERYLRESHPSVGFYRRTAAFSKPDDFRSLRSAVEEKRADSYISCLRSKRFIWHSDGTPLSYRIDAKPLRQAFGGTLIETGAFYASTVGDITRSGRLLSGRIGIVETSPGTDIDIDEPIDWLKAEALAKAGTMIQ